MPQVSIIIPVYNQLVLLLQCLSSLMATTPPEMAEIILIDDCSTEFNLSAMTGLPFSLCKVTRAPTNLGFAGACNLGAIQSAAPILYFLNSDTLAHPNWLPPMLETMATDKVAISGPKLIFPNGKLQSCGGGFDVLKGPYHKFIGYDPAHRFCNKRGKVDWITGAAQMVRADVFAACGGYDEGYQRGYYEDVDLCMSVQMQGYEVWYEPRAVFTHAVGQSGATKTPDEQHKAAQSFQRNRYRFHHRWDARIVPDTDQPLAAGL